MLFPLTRIWRPAAYQGGGTTRRYFEGFYYKQVTADRSQALSIIPGISFSPDGEARHAFIQIVPGGGTAHYFSHPVDEFSWSARDPYRVTIGGSTFDRYGITLDTANDEHSVTGALRFGRWVPWPVKAFSPGIMGPYRFAPRMETYHAVLSMDHSVMGEVTIDGREWCFDHGRGYVEKDWGRSFPSSWVWAQSNTFAKRGTSVTLSVAKVPWMGGSFVGNIAGLFHDGVLHRFATYTGARLRCIETASSEARLVIGDRREELEVRLHGSDALILKAPVLGAMEGRDAESLGGTIDVELRSLHGGRAQTVFEGTGHQAGIEIMNDAGELTADECEAEPAT